MVSLAARRYALALYELARDKGIIAAVNDEWMKVQKTLSDPAVMKKVADPKVGLSEKKALLSTGLGAGSKSFVKNTVSLLIDRRRETEILGVALAYFELVERGEGVLRIDLETAQELAADTRERLVGGLSKAIGKKVVLNVKVMPELIGGMRLIVDSRLIDGSVKKRLDVLSRRLKAAV